MTKTADWRRNALPAIIYCPRSDITDPVPGMWDIPGTGCGTSNARDVGTLSPHPGHWMWGYPGHEIWEQLVHGSPRFEDISRTTATGYPGTHHVAQFWCGIFQDSTMMFLVWKSRSWGTENIYQKFDQLRKLLLHKFSNLKYEKGLKYDTVLQNYFFIFE